jgi:arginyl-tRNA synthetase
MIGQSTVARVLEQVIGGIEGVSLKAPEIESLLETPKDSSHGDIAFPCFQLARALKKAPPAIAADLVATLAPILESETEIQKVVAIGPYINFILNKASLAAALIPAIVSGDFLKQRASKPDRVMVEYGNVNTHKSFHVGHIRNASLGDTISRLFTWNGFSTVRVNYLGDEGSHVAKCIWYLLNHPERKMPESNRLEFMGEAYVNATSQLDIGMYSRCELRGVKTARVDKIETHPTEAEWFVVTLTTAEGTKQVVSQKKTASAVQPGWIVAHAAPGVTVGSRQIGVADRKGVESYGLMLAEDELGVGEGKTVLKVEVPTELLTLSSEGIGLDLIEIYKIPRVLPEGQLILPTLQKWNGEVSAILQKLESQDPEMKEFWLNTRQWSIDELKETFAWLNCSFDHFFYESEYGETSKDLVREFQKKGVFVESQGAVGADLSKDGLGFCVLIKRDGTALYATRDLALAQRKFEEFKIDRSVYVVDAAQTLHFQQVFRCLELMGYEQVKKCFHCSYAQVVTPEGKMSSRKGKVILMSALKERLLSKIQSEFLDKYIGEWPDAERHEAARRIALATMRYGMLNVDNNSLVVFDMDAWTSKTGNTGPYMMYAYARTRSILRELGVQTLDLSEAKWELLTDETEIDVLRLINEYHSVIESACERYSPHLVCAYVYDLAKRFSRMYQQCSVLHAETPELKLARAGLVCASGLVIQHGLSLLGIETVERM